MSDLGGTDVIGSIGVRSPAAAVRSRRKLAHRMLLGLGVGLTLLVLIAAGAPTAPDEQQYLTAAATARTAYRYDRALAWYAAASASRRDDPRPHCLAGEVLLLQAEPVAAVAAYQTCVGLALQDGSSWLGLGEARSAAGDMAGAESAWERAATLGRADALRRLGQFYESQGRFAEAQAIWDRLPAGDGQALAHRGLLALWRGDTATARADFLAARHAGSADEGRWEADGLVAIALAAGSPADATWLGRLGYRFLTAGMPQLALAPLQQAATLGPQMGSAHAYLGWTLWLLGRKSEARTQLTQGIRLAPALSFAWFAAAVAAADGGDTARALALVQKALDLDGHNPVVWAEAGQLELAQRDYIAAELALGNAAHFSSDPGYSVLLLQFYATYHVGLTAGRAVTAASDAADRFPESEPVQFLLAEILDLAGRQDDAYYAATTALTLDPTDPGPYVLLGRYAEDEENYVTAALDLRTALALQPNGSEAAQARDLLGPIADIPV